MQPPIGCPTEGCLVTSSRTSYRHVSKTYPRKGNITGLSFLSAELPGKRLELLKETVPQSARIAVLANPASPYHESNMNHLTVAARVLGLQLHVVELHRADELDTAFVA